ncbi:hypothetical protein [Scleromatobacter humisilvae]|uniref:Uncharacterized protein n=1 Tax=Scleromatobacter humisilvae TaxID=2897159 RepID=A0A9X2C1Q9_9BURK|nr:hypothetical protein [Scleromatobacter humisilvae]MCK9686044.1 hypothetical protein [Scleromatobacter humisilvae]
MSAPGKLDCSQARLTQSDGEKQPNELIKRVFDRAARVVDQSRRASYEDLEKKTYGNETYLDPSNAVLSIDIPRCLRIINNMELLRVELPPYSHRTSQHW